MTMLARILALTPAIRYAAIYRDDTLDTLQRRTATQASSAASDRYEELLVNPTLLTLVRQRGNIDCGGAHYVIVRYGHFYQLVLAIDRGHVSVCFELAANPLEYIDQVLAIAGMPVLGSAS